MLRIRALYLGCFVLCAAVSFAASRKSSTTYTFDYVSPAASGSVAQAGVYNVVSQVHTTRFGTTPTSSTLYQVTPLVGSAGADSSSVRGWGKY